MTERCSICEGRLDEGGSDPVPMTDLPGEYRTVHEHCRDRLTDPNDDTFICDRCGGRYDIEVSVRIGKDILVCESCVEQRLG